MASLVLTLFLPVTNYIRIGSKFFFLDLNRRTQPIVHLKSVYPKPPAISCALSCSTSPLASKPFGWDFHQDSRAISISSYCPFLRLHTFGSTCCDSYALLILSAFFIQDDRVLWGTPNSKAMAPLALPPFSTCLMALYLMLSDLHCILLFAGCTPLGWWYFQCCRCSSYSTFCKIERQLVRTSQM